MPWPSTTKKARECGRAGPRQRPRPRKDAPLLRTRYRPRHPCRVLRVNQACIQMNGEFPHQRRGSMSAPNPETNQRDSQVMQQGPRSNELGMSPDTRVPCLVPETTTHSSGRVMQPVIRARQDEPERGHYATRPVTSLGPELAVVSQAPGPRSVLSAHRTRHRHQPQSGLPAAWPAWQGRASPSVSITTLQNARGGTPVNQFQTGERNHHSATLHASSKAFMWSAEEGG